MTPPKHFYIKDPIKGHLETYKFHKETKKCIYGYSQPDNKLRRIIKKNHTIHYDLRALLDEQARFISVFFDNNKERIKHAMTILWLNNVNKERAFDLTEDLCNLSVTMVKELRLYMGLLDKFIGV
jgi:hypothetical protein